MDAIAKELSDSCGLTLHAIPLWVGGGHMSYGMTFFDNSMAPEYRTPGDAERLAELERLLESTGISKTPKPKFELLCSAAYRRYPLEPTKMAERSPPPGWNGLELISIMQELKEKRQRPERKSEKQSQEKGGLRSGKRPRAKKRESESGAEVTPEDVDHPRFVLTCWGLI